MARTSKSTSNRSVRNNSAKPSARAASSGASPAQSKQASKPKPKAAKVDPNYQLSSEVLSEEHNEVHPPDMAYGIVVNDEPAGILIPLDQLEEAGWTDLPDEDDLTTCKFGKNRVTGLFLTQARVLILGKRKDYIQTKSEGDELPEFVGFYDEKRDDYDPETMEIRSDYAFIFLDDDNQPLHTAAAIKISWRKIARKEFNKAIRKFRRQLEKTFVDYCTKKKIRNASGKPITYSGKGDAWHACAILDLEFIAEDRGSDQTHPCCITVIRNKPSWKTFEEIFYFGSVNAYQQLTSQREEIIGFIETSSPVPVLPSSSSQPEAESDEIDESDDDFLDVEAEEVLDNDEGDEGDEDDDLDDEDDEFDFEEDED
ncbi:hypothetical protein C7B80_03065 [Cyanosarcina cf. burmensis CCALA 770]|nr:hypothetical protein C7B80_03065 [Cyanosarcina cf. burmensis CCALA 770]